MLQVFNLVHFIGCLDIGKPILNQFKLIEFGRVLWILLLWFYSYLVGKNPSFCRTPVLHTVVRQGSSGEARAAMLRVLCVGESQVFLEGGSRKSIGCWGILVDLVFNQTFISEKWRSTRYGMILRKWKFQNFQTHHISLVPVRTSPSPRAFVRGPPCVWQSRWCGPKQCSVVWSSLFSFRGGIPMAFFLWENPRYPTFRTNFRRHGDLFGRLHLNGMAWINPTFAAPRRRMPWCGRSICRHFLLQQFQKHFQVVLWFVLLLYLVVLHWKSL